MATSRIATQPKVLHSPKSAKSPHEVQPNDPMVAKARAVADTIRQLERGHIPRNLPKLPLFNKEGTDFAPGAFPVRPNRAKPPERRKSSRPQSGAASPPDLARHRRKCVVCNHPDREEIEEQFIHWRRPGDIAHDFDLEETRYIHRHAHAVGLYARRRENYLFTLENLLERGDEIELTASAYIKAVRAYACMCDTVRWTEPAIRVIGIRDSHADRPRDTDAAPAATHSTDSLAESQGIAGTTSTLPEAASNQLAPAADSGTHSHGTRKPVRFTGIETGASAPIGGAAAPLPASSFEPLASQLEELTLSGVEGQTLPNRPSPRLETELSDRKQRKEVLSNRP